MNRNSMLLPNIQYTPSTSNSRIIWIDTDRLILIFTTYKNNNGCAILFDDVQYFKRSFDTLEKNIVLANHTAVLYENKDKLLIDQLGLNRKIYKHYFSPVFMKKKLDIISTSFKILDRNVFVF